MGRQPERQKNTYSHSTSRKKKNENDAPPTKTSRNKTVDILSPQNSAKIIKPPRKSVIVKPTAKPQSKEPCRSDKGSRSSRDSKHVQIQEPSLDPNNLENAFHVSLEGVREHILKTGKAEFEQIYENLSKRAAAHILEDEAFLEKVTSTIEILNAPLSEEKIETTTKKGVQVVEIGQRMAEYKMNIEKEEEKLTNYWDQYQQVQLEFEELGVQIFGAEALRVDEDKYEQVGFLCDVESLEAEQNAKLDEILKELDEVGNNSIKKMKASEKDFESVVNKERSRLLAAYIE